MRARAVPGAVAVAASLATAAGTSEAGTPSPARALGPWDPARSNVALSGQGAPCQFRFRPGGGADILWVDITLRDAFDVPVVNCSTSVTLVPVGTESFNFCTCCGDVQTGFTDSTGTLRVSWDRIGGFGTLEVGVTAHCWGDIAVGAPTLEYTSSDLTGTCDDDVDPVNRLDLALWARGLPPGMWIRSDWDCSGGSADIIDAGGWASGWTDQCDDGGPCP